MALGATAVVAGGPGSSAAQRAERPLTLQDLGKIYGHAFELAPPPAGQTPEQRAHWLLSERQANGRTPNDWITSAKGFSLDAALTPPPAAADLTANVLAIYALARLTPSPVDVISILNASARVPSPVREAFADLVGTVAGAYAAQLPLAAAVTARLAGGFDPTVQLVTPAERDAMSVRQSDIVRALATFRARLAAAPPQQQDDPIFSDPEGLVILGGQGDDTYERSGLFPDPILLVDPSGSDTYLNSAGGACPVTPEVPGSKWLQCNSLAVSVVADLGQDGSNDSYLYDGEPAAVQGAGGPGGLGILVDVAGDDRYIAKMTRGTTDAIFQYVDGGGQGYGFAGEGLQLDLLGNDIFRFDVFSSAGNSIWAFAQGFGGGGGVGISADMSGTDDWLSNGLGLVGGGFEGIYTQGMGIWGGVGVMVDAGMGDDIYRSTLEAQTVDYYAQGFGAFGGVGIMYEDGGNDDYYTLEHGTAPFIDPLLNCAYGTASFAGVGIMLDLGGNDTYYGTSISDTGGASVMDSGFGGPGVAYGLFMDVGGDDHYTMEAFGTHTMLSGRGLWEPGLTDDPFDYPAGMNTWGTFVDIGGNDTYQGGAGANNSQWPFGVDRG